MLETAVCGKCGLQYSRYVILIKNNFVAISDYKFEKDYYGNICSDYYGEEAMNEEYVIIPWPGNTEYVGKGRAKS